MAYIIPAQPIIDEQIIKKSRFITYISHAENKNKALAFIQYVKTEHPDARHHCWAYIAGHPTATIDIAMSDDGEPQGTAGKPILNVLQHRNIGEIVLVVVRYFGGIKLGAGGLVRAYSSSAHLAVEKLPTKTLVTTRKMKLVFDYALESKVTRYLQENHIAILHADYSARISLFVAIAEQEIQKVEAELIDKTTGKIHVTSAD